MKHFRVRLTTNHSLKKFHKYFHFVHILFVRKDFLLQTPEALILTTPLIFTL